MRWHSHRLMAWLLVLALAAPGIHAETSDSGQTMPEAQPPPTIVVRTGEHPGFSRIVFDWVETVAYQIHREGGDVIVAFDRQADFDLSRLRPQPARWIDFVLPSATAEGAVVRLGVGEDARLRHLRVGEKVVVDIYASRRPRPKAKKAPPASVADPIEPATPVTHSAGAGNDIALEPAAAAAAPLVPEASHPDVAAPASTPAAPVTMQPPDPASITAAQSAVQSALPPAVPIPENGDERRTKSGADSPSAPWQALRFAWPEPTAAAVFRRGGWIWIVFDRASDPSVLASARGAGKALQQLPHDRATILRLADAPGLDPVAERDGFSWIIRPAPSPTTPRQPIAPEVETDPAVRVLLRVEGAGPSVTVADPEMGDTLMIVPLIPPGRGIAHGYEYPQFGLLQTAQGIVIVPRADDLQLASLDDGIAISGTGGLHVSPVSQAERDRARLRSATHLTRVFDPESWPEERSGDSFLARERELRQAAAAASDAERDEALLALAHFYLAHGLATECVAALAQSQGGLRDAEKIARLRLLRGACSMLMGRLDEARIDLSDASLDGVDEGALWRAALDALQGNGKAASAELLRTGPIALGYSSPVRAPLLRVVVEAALAADDQGTAQAYLDALRSEPSGGISRGHLALLEGRLRALEGDHDGAVAKWAEAEQSNDRWSRAEAAFDRIRAQIERNEITAKDAIEALEALRYAWRGGGFEFTLLRQLAGLYGDLGDHRRQLTALRQAASSFPEHPQVAEVVAEMTAMFEKLYLGGGADAMAPLSAIALFDEFRELTPAGDRGNEMMRRLADRLVAVDLLDRAALLLEEQVRHRLHGTEQAKVGARLALVYLLDQKPEQALKALDASATAEMSADLVRQRHHLKARALADLRRFDEALLLLADDLSPDADLIRSDVFWQNQDWKQADQVLARLAFHAGARPGQPLDDTQARYVLNRAVSLTLAADEAGLARLRQDHGREMETSPYGDAFRLIASTRTESTTDVRALVQANVRAAEGFQTFLAAYRDRLRQNTLSAIN